MQELLFEEITDEVLEDLQITREEIEPRCLKYPQELPRLKTVPTGYKKKGGDPNLLVIDPVVLLFLDVTLDQLDKGTSYRLSVDYFNSRMEKYGRTNSLSHAGLKKLWDKYRPGNRALTGKVMVFPKRMSRERRSFEIRKKKIAIAKKEITTREKKIKRLKEEVEKKKQEEQEDKKALKSNIVLVNSEVDYTEFDELKEKEKAFVPNPGPQTAFLSAPELQVLYGGAAGGEPVSGFSASFHSNVSK